ncbi:MAG: 30S ribosomal protein S18 [Candidatus Omnitrophica bacterium]|nr:30S ribosomal protein S18 [Candidatus Omnitrophota bacterium]
MRLKKDIVKKDKKKKTFAFGLGKRRCPLCRDKIKDVDYKDVKRLERFIHEKGKIVSRRRSAACARHQRKLVRAIKNARFLALLPYVR